jgi:hypothetical protein
MLKIMKCFFVSVFAAICSDLIAMDVGCDVAMDLAFVCTKTLLEKYPACISNIKVDAPISSTIIEGAPCNYCAIAIVDHDSKKIFFLNGNIEEAIRKGVAYSLVDDICVFNSIEPKGLKPRLRDLYSKSAELLACDAVFKCLPEMLDQVRKGDSEQIMLLALRNATTRDAFLKNINPKSSNVELII